MKQFLSLSAVLAVILLGCSNGGQGSNDKSASGAASAAQSSPPAKASVSGEMKTETAAGLSFQVLSSWKSTTPSSNMRAAQYSLPVAKEGDEAPELVLYFFGAGQGGSTENNINRWIGQMQEPDGKSSADVAKRDNLQIGNLKAATVRLSGTYSSTMMPGMGTPQTKPGYRIWGAVIEGEGGPWFFKAVGPEADMEAAEPALDALLTSIKPAK